jgi:hypothetical protein
MVRVVLAVVTFTSRVTRLNLRQELSFGLMIEPGAPHITLITKQH